MNIVSWCPILKKQFRCGKFRECKARPTIDYLVRHSALSAGIEGRWVKEGVQGHPSLLSKHGFWSVFQFFSSSFGSAQSRHQKRRHLGFGVFIDIWSMNDHLARRSRPLSAVCKWVHVRKMQFCAAVQILPKGTICTPCLQGCRVRTPYLGDNLFAGLVTWGGVGDCRLATVLYICNCTSTGFFSSMFYNTVDVLNKKLVLF